MDSNDVDESNAPVEISEEEENHDNLTDEDYLKQCKKNQRSGIWDHFTKDMVDGVIKAICNYCRSAYTSNPSINGTSSLKRHLNRCPKYSPNVEIMKAKKQKILCGNIVSQGSKEMGTCSFSNEHLNRLCVEMIIKDELPFNHVEGEGFQNFMGKALPFWKIPCRQTIAKEVLKMYASEKEKLISQLKGKRVCLTTDTWTSIQNINYMVVTAHFIDDDWVLHKRVISFCVIDDHKGESIATLLEDCVMEWGIEKILTITVDNASANDVAIRELIKKLESWGSPNMLLDRGRNVHMRCIAHILNLIVNDGLRPMTSSIDAIRNAVRYVRSSPQRLDLFKQIVEKVKIESKGLVVLDVPTRWNSTYMMLESALKFQKAFDRLSEQDTRNYVAYFKNGKEGPPYSMDWKNAEVFSKFLKPFYEVTLRVCCSSAPTINNTFNDLLYIHDVLEQQTMSPSVEVMSLIVPPMVEKYKKYWDDFSELNEYVFLALVLDPRQKFEKLVDYFECVFGDEYEKEGVEYERVETATKEVRSLLSSMYIVYEKEYEGVFGGVDTNETHTSNDMSNMSLPTGLTEFEKNMKEKELKRKAKKAEIISNDIDRYIHDPIEGDANDFDILAWWKVSGVSKYPILSRIARDVLAIPVSTISSESSFSTSGRIISPHRSSLSTKMVQALICTQSWLRGEAIAFNDLSYNEDIELSEEAERAIGDTSIMK